MDVDTILGMVVITKRDGLTLEELRDSLDAALAGNQDAFEQITAPYRRELYVHCYRMLGSMEDAEDILQETFLRAWRKLSTLVEPASLRAWLYRIATNASLDLIERRRIRIMPDAADPLLPGDALPDALPDTHWIEPLPDALIDDQPSANPEVRYQATESIALAFLAALQYLPGRQRAVLILRDVLGWNAKETADILAMSSVAVNSALQRARATIQQHRPSPQPDASTPDDLIQSLLTRYVQAWETADTGQLIELLREDAYMTMPPLPAWYRGREAIRWFLESMLFTPAMHKPMRLLPTRANGCPAFVVYQPNEGSEYRPVALHVLTIQDGQIAAIDDFLSFDGRLFARFEVPSFL
jgi:RNA polymerase sigma-70 factor, ECF subfamily